MRRLLIVFTIAMIALIANAAYSKQEPIPQEDRAQQQETIPQEDRAQQMEQNILLMDKKIHDLEEQIKTLKQSHEMAILINQDLDERISKIEEKYRK